MKQYAVVEMDKTNQNKEVIAECLIVAVEAVVAQPLHVLMII